MVGTVANSDPAVQIVPECLSPECPLSPKAAVQIARKTMLRTSAFGQKQTSLRALATIAVAAIAS